MLGRKPNAIVDQKTKKIIVQTPLPTFNCLALEGGGVRGSAYAGAFTVLSRYGLLNDIQHVAGSSAGAIAAMLVALGYSAEEIVEELYTIPMEAFMEQKRSWPFTPDFFARGRKLFSILTNEKIALSTGSIMMKWLEERVAKKLGKTNASFGDLARAVESTENQAAKNKMKYLYVTSTNITNEIPECWVFSHQTDPDAPIATGVCASGMFPFYFAAVEWNGQKFYDGGCKNNLPAKIFDRTEFLPEGYTFTDRGTNPGVLAVKIDYRAETDQVIWGIRKKTKISTVRELTSAIAYAFADNIDATEVRESRTVLSLVDNNIDSLNFNIDITGKIKLSSKAEETTRDFLENHINAAYQIKIYDSFKNWIDALSQDELDEVIAIYETESNRLDASSEETKNHIQFLQSYAVYKREKRRHPELIFNQAIPENHINIKPVLPENRWDAVLMEEMQTRLKAMEYHLKITNQRIQEVKQDFGDDCDNFLAQQLHYDQSADFENIKKLTGFLEYRRILEDEKTDLEIKLGLKKTSSSPEHNKNYPELCKWLAEQQGEKQLDPALKAIISQIDVYSPIIAHKSMDEGDNILFTFNLRQKEDCKLFMIAASLYLEYRHSKNKDIFRELYTRIFPGEVAPKSMYALSGAINQLGISLLVAAYRIEELMLFFSRTEHPHKKPSIDIDHVFGTARHSIFSFIEKRTKNPPELSIAMRNFFKTKIEDRASDHDDIELKSVRQPLAS